MTDSIIVSIPAGIHRHHFIQNAEENSHSGAQTLPDPPDPTLLHEKGEVHPAELPRPAHADHRRLPKTRRKFFYFFPSCGRVYFILGSVCDILKFLWVSRTYTLFTLI